MKKPKPPCETVLPWLKANLGTRCLAPLTGQDSKALAAAVHIVECWSYGSRTNAACAFGLIVNTMQPSTQHLAFHAIAHVLDWGHRLELWEAAGLPRCAVQLRCRFESRLEGAA